MNDTYFEDWYYTQHGMPVTTIASQLSSQERLYRMVSEMATATLLYVFILSLSSIKSWTSVNKIYLLLQLQMRNLYKMCQCTVSTVW